MVRWNAIITGLKKRPIENKVKPKKSNTKLEICRKELELRQRELDLQRREIEVLKRENELLKPQQHQTPLTPAISEGVKQSAPIPKPRKTIGLSRSLTPSEVWKTAEVVGPETIYKAVIEGEKIKHFTDVYLPDVFNFIYSLLKSHNQTVDIEGYCVNDSSGKEYNNIKGFEVYYHL